MFNYRISARPERRRQFEKELISAMEVALSLLTACLNASELKEQVKFFIFYPDCSVLCGIVLFRGVIYILC